MCKDNWDDSDLSESCTNQQGCTDCAGEGRTRCVSANPDCDEVERDRDGVSQGWFWCDADTVVPTTGTAFENECVRFWYISK